MTWLQILLIVLYAMWGISEIIWCIAMADEKTRETKTPFRIVVVVLVLAMLLMFFSGVDLILEFN